MERVRARPWRGGRGLYKRRRHEKACHTVENEHRWRACPAASCDQHPSPDTGHVALGTQEAVMIHTGLGSSVVRNMKPCPDLISVEVSCAV